MKTILAILIAITINNGHSKSVVFPSGRLKPVSMMANFEKNCSDQNALSTLCQSWAAILKNETQGLLLILQSSSHPENIKIFENAATLSDPHIKAMSLTYLEKVKERDDQGLLTVALNSMFSEDSFLGKIAAVILGHSSSQNHTAISNDFVAGHDSYLYEDFSNFSTVLVNEWSLDNGDSYQNFYLPNQERFMPLDRFYYSQSNYQILGGKGFLVTDSLNQVIAHFQSSTGKAPATPFNKIQEKIESLSTQMQEIMARIQRGDYSQMARLQAIQIEMQTLSSEQTQWVQLGINEESMNNSTVFFFSSAGDSSVLEGAILVKEVPLYQKTAIQYFDKRQALEQ